MNGGRIRKRVENALRSAPERIWFIPTLEGIVAIGLAAALLYADASLASKLGESGPWLFAGTADGARSILTVIAGSLVTVVAVAFSVTVIAIQQASAQYSPRLLRNFTRDRGNQVVLGTYIATFIYCLLVLREVRTGTPEAEPFIPTLSIFGAIVLALVSLGLLIYFIHHITDSLQVSYLLERIRSELDHEIQRRFPTTFGPSSADPPTAAQLLRHHARRRRKHEHVVCSKREEGYLRRIDESALKSALADPVELAEIPVRIGEYVHRDTVLLRVWPRAPLHHDFDEHVRNAFSVDRGRSVLQDPLYGVQQLVDVGLKALSPSVHDPTTAIQVLDQLGGWLATLIGREMPSPARDLGDAQCVFATPRFSEFIETGLGAMRRSARGQVRVQLHLLSVFQSLAERCPSRERAAPLRLHVCELLNTLPGSGLTAHDEAVLRTRATEVLKTLDTRLVGRT